MSKKKRKSGGYAERLARRRFEFGEGPVMSRDGRRMPLPRPVGERMFGWTRMAAAPVIEPCRQLEPCAEHPRVLPAVAA